MKALDDLAALLKRIPGIGPKSASRIAFQLVRTKPEFNELLGESISTIQEKIHKCPVCGSYIESEQCPLCNNPDIDKSVICVVEQPMDVITIQELGVYKGLFHVLGGVINPLAGIGPENLSFNGLIKRVSEGDVKEIIVATNPTEYGNITAMYLRKILLSYPEVKLTRLATGIPVGGDLEFSDHRTLVDSLSGRIPF